MGMGRWRRDEKEGRRKRERQEKGRKSKFAKLEENEGKREWKRKQEVMVEEEGDRKRKGR